MRAVVSGGPFVTVGFLVATLRHVDEFHSAVGVIWVGACVFAVPAFLAAAVHQPAIPGRDRPVEDRLPQWLRGALGMQAIVMLAWASCCLLGPITLARCGRGRWRRRPPRRFAVWLIGIGGSAAYITLQSASPERYSATEKGAICHSKATAAGGSAPDRR